MLSTSFEFRAKIAQNSKTVFKATLTLANGGVRELVGDDIMMGTPKFTDAVSSDSSFDIGAAIMNKFDFTLNNYDRRFDECDFTGSTVVPYVGVILDNGDTEWLMKGHYGVEPPESYGSTIGISALDNMRKFERPYSEIATTYPATLRTILLDVCNACDVTLADPAFANSTYVVQARPEDDALTCLNVVSFVAQVAGCFARCDANGQLLLSWYNTSVIEGEDWLDGMRFDDETPYASGDTADGGDFTDYNSGDTVDGGLFGANVFANVHAYSNAAIATDDVVITGMRVKAQDEIVEDGTEGREGESALFGSDGYVLSIEGNPLIEFGKASAVASQIGSRVVGMRFRPFDISALGNPAVEAGDPIIITDNLQNQYLSYITSLVYKAGGYETYACRAETPSRNSATSYNSLTKAIVHTRNALKNEKTAREKAVEELARGLAESSGLYMTEQRQQDGSHVYYMHNKPTLAESQIIWKLTANAFGISTDGGETYPYGFDVSGNAILNRIYAIGLNADYLYAGAIAIADKQSGKTLFKADYDTSEVLIDASRVRVSTGSTSATDLQAKLSSIDQTASGISATVASMQAVYGTCSTASGTQSKAVTCANFSLRAGAMVCVRFTYANTAASPQLNVNSTGAKPVYVNNVAMTSENYWKAGDILTLVYSGSYWYVVDGSTLGQLSTTNNNVANLVVRADAFDVSIKGLQASYGTCSTSAATQTKVVTIPNFTKFVGQTATIRFAYSNTASSPILKVQNSDGSVAASGHIYVNGSIMGQYYWWNAGDVLTLVWDGSGWRVGDGGTMSRIQVLQNSISLTVSNLALGSTASIKMSVGGTQITNVSADLSKVRKAFANDTSAITISAGIITFNSNTFVVNSTNFSVTSAGVITATSGTIGGFTLTSSSIYNSKMTLNSNGLSLKLDSTDLGDIGTGHYSQDSSKKGLTFDLSPGGAYMSWSAKANSSDTTYSWKLLYAQKAMGSDIKADTLHSWANWYCHGYKAYGIWLDPNTSGASGGISGKMPFVQVTSMSSNGTASYWYNSCYLTFKNGLLIGASAHWS